MAKEHYRIREFMFDARPFDYGDNVEEIDPNVPAQIRHVGNLLSKENIFASRDEVKLLLQRHHFKLEAYFCDEDNNSLTTTLSVIKYCDDLPLFILSHQDNPIYG